MRAYPHLSWNSVSLLALAWLLPAGAAHAQEARSQDDSYVAIELVLGVVGEADSEVTVGGATASGSTDLEASLGVALAWMHPLHRYFALGVQFGAMSWTTENANDRNVLTDLLLVPQGRLPVSDELELTLSLPVGGVLDFWGGDEVSVQVAGATVVTGDVAPAVGFELGFLLGVRYAVSSDVGLVAQLGYVLHSFEHEVEVSVPALGTTGKQNVDISLGQPRLQVGVSF